MARKVIACSAGDNGEIATRKWPKWLSLFPPFLFPVLSHRASLMFMAMASEPKFFVDGEYKNLLLAIGGLCLLLEPLIRR